MDFKCSLIPYKCQGKMSQNDKKEIESRHRLNDDKNPENDKKEFCKAVCLIDENKIINNMVLNLLNRLFGSSIDALPNSSVAVEEKKKRQQERR